MNWQDCTLIRFSAGKMPQIAKTSPPIPGDPGAIRTRDLQIRNLFPDGTCDYSVTHSNPLNNQFSLNIFGAHSILVLIAAHRFTTAPASILLPWGIHSVALKKQHSPHQDQHRSAICGRCGICRVGYEVRGVACARPPVRLKIVLRILSQ